MEYQIVTHEFEPIYDAHSKILILGSLPSVKSREQGFYYGHPQNRFWRVVAALTGEQVPEIKFFANGTKAYELYQRYAYTQTQKEIVKLPSTSPANAAWSLEKLCVQWRQLLGI